MLSAFGHFFLSNQPDALIIQIYSAIKLYMSLYMLSAFGHFFLSNQPDALIIQIYSAIKLYMFLASSLPFIRSFLLYIWH